MQSKTLFVRVWGRYPTEQAYMYVSHKEFNAYRLMAGLVSMQYRLEFKSVGDR